MANQSKLETPADTPDEGGLRLSSDHSRRFNLALCQAIEANDALRIASQTFPNCDIGAKETSPRLAIEAYGGVLHRRLHAMLSLYDGSEPDKGYEGDGHGS